MAPRDVQPGRSFAGEITRAIQHSKVFVLIFSAHSNASEQVLREVQLAVDSHLHIVQFRIEDTHINDDLRYYLSTPHWLDALTPPLENHLARLEVSIAALLRISTEGSPKRASADWIIPQHFLGNAQSGTMLILEPISGATAPAILPIHLVARKEFRISRSLPPDGDFLTWFWPRSKENDEKTKRLSKKHVVAKVQGDDLILRDEGSANGATFEGHPLFMDKDEILDQRGTLSLAQEYRLDISPFESTIPKGLRIANERDWSGPSDSRPVTKWGSVRFTPINSEVAHHHALWLFTDANFGHSTLNPVIINASGLAEVEGRFHYYRRNFWIEDLPEGTAISVEGHKLVPREIVPLANGNVVEIGNVILRARIEP